MNKILEIKNISKKYNTLLGEIEAIKNISLDIYENEFITIVGNSGCGKSTLLNLISELEDISSGGIIKKDNLVIGYMLQEDALLPWLTIYDNIALGLKIQNKLTIENKEYINKLLLEYNLLNYKNKYPSCLSGGMKQRVALIRTLVLKPDLILLDEPFSALDYQSRLAISNDVYNIIKKEQKTAIMVTHDLTEAISLGDKVILLSKKPAIIKKIFKIELPNTGNILDKRYHENFIKYYNDIWKEFDLFVK